MTSSVHDSFLQSDITERKQITEVQSGNSQLLNAFAFAYNNIMPKQKSLNFKGSS